jgi:hypothetical protein
MNRVSYWQIGFNDGYAGNDRQWPTPDGPYELRNSGYSNGYDEGRRKRRNEQAPQRYAAMVARWRCPDCHGVSGCKTCGWTGYCGEPVSTGWDSQSCFRVGG